MTRAPSFAGIILAAGSSSRMGRDKALLPWHGRTFLTANIDLLQEHTELVIVVAGANYQVLAPLIYAAGASMIVNPAPERAQFSSLQMGVQEVLNRGRDAAVIALVDRPPVRTETLTKLRDAFAKAAAAEKWAVVPEFEGRHGHPILAGREMITAFLKAPVTSNAREIEHANQQYIQYAAVDDPLTVANVDTPEDYERLTALRAKQ